MMDNINNNKINKKTDVSYGYYSKVLMKPFDTIEELRIAEEEYYAKIKAKEDAAKAKKADAQVVEEAFIALNAARKKYKTELSRITTEYAAQLAKVGEEFKAAKAAATSDLASAEGKYEEALKAFTAKHPEGFHLTLKDGDYETTISSKVTQSSNKDINLAKELPSIFDFLFW